MIIPIFSNTNVTPFYKVLQSLVPFLFTHPLPHHYTSPIQHTYLIKHFHHLQRGIREEEGDDILLSGQHAIVHHQALLVGCAGVVMGWGGGKG